MWPDCREAAYLLSSCFAPIIIPQIHELKGIKNAKRCLSPAFSPARGYPFDTSKPSRPTPAQQPPTAAPPPPPPLPNIPPPPQCLLQQNEILSDCTSSRMLLSVSICIIELRRRVSTSILLVSMMKLSASWQEGSQGIKRLGSAIQESEPQVQR